MLRRGQVDSVAWTAIKLAIAAIMIILAVMTIITLYNAVFSPDTQATQQLALRTNYLIQGGAEFFGDEGGRDSYAKTSYLMSGRGDKALVVYGTDQDSVTIERTNLAQSGPGNSPQSITLEKGCDGACICEYALPVSPGPDNPNPPVRGQDCYELDAEALQAYRVHPGTPADPDSVKATYTIPETSTDYPGGETYAPAVIPYTEGEDAAKSTRQLFLYLEYYPETDPPSLLVTPDEQNLGGRAATLTS